MRSGPQEIWPNASCANERKNERVLYELEWVDEKTNYKRLLNDSVYTSNWSYEKWYPKGTYINEKIFGFVCEIVFSLPPPISFVAFLSFRLQSWSRDTSSGIQYVLPFVFPYLNFLLIFFILPTNKIRWKWRCCFNTSSKSFASLQKSYLKLSKSL